MTKSYQILLYVDTEQGLTQCMEQYKNVTNFQWPPETKGDRERGGRDRDSKPYYEAPGEFYL